MKTLISKDKVNKLIPILTKKQKIELAAYFSVFEKYSEEFNVKAKEDLKDHPEFGNIIRNMPEDVYAENNKLSLKFQKDAILKDKWKPFINFQIEQGRTYARIGLDFKSWYEVIAMLRNFLTPYLHHEYGNTDKFISAINGMNYFLDISMANIGEAYMREKNETIQENQNKIKKLNIELENKVIERTKELEEVNKELESFTYSVSHDLRAPLRAINGYAVMLNEDYGSKLEKDGIRILGNIKIAATKMGTLIDDLLAFSRLGRKEILKTNINMNELTESVLQEVNKSISHSAKIKVGKLHNIKADYGLMQQVMFNLISNAIKYSSNKEKPLVEINSSKNQTEVIYAVKDNGAGFNMKYYDKLFGVFQRLHSQLEFEGTGVGLALTHRIINRHKGEIWAEGKENEGATFYFSLKK